MTPLEDFRSLKDEFYKLDPDSPLTPEQKQVFKGLIYFPENPDLRFVLPVEKFEKADKIKMPTSTGAMQEYTRYGRIHFSVEGQPVELTVFSSGHDEFFLPFADSLTGRETYDAGRYLEPEWAGNGKLLVDFNYAYNPYCAYNDYWSCPITPFENRIKVPIRAGEKLFCLDPILK
jgi:uncharacterized protein